MNGGDRDSASNSGNLPTYKIFVSNLPPGFNNNELYELFQPYGTVVECEVFGFRNFAFVHMTDRANGMEAKRALNGTMVKGYRISVSESKNTKSGPKHLLNTSGKDSCGTFKLFFSNLPASVKKETLQTLLEPFGRIVEIEIYRSSAAFVHVENEEVGKKIIEEMNNKNIDDQSISVCHSRNPEGPNIPVMKLSVKHIGENVTAEQLRELFRKYGLVLKCEIHALGVANQNKSRDAIVTLEALGDIRSAISEMNGYELDGETLEVAPLLESPKKQQERRIERAPAPPQMLRGRGMPPPFRGRGMPPRGMMPMRGRGGGYMGRPMSMLRPGHPRPLMPGSRPLRLVPMPSVSEGYPNRVPRYGRGTRPQPPPPTYYEDDYYGEEEYEGYEEAVEDPYGYGESYAEDTTGYEEWQEGGEEVEESAYYGEYDSTYGYPTPTRATTSAQSFRQSPMWKQSGGPPSKRMRGGGGASAAAVGNSALVARQMADTSFQEDVGTELMGDGGAYAPSPSHEQGGYHEAQYTPSYSTSYPLKTSTPGSSSANSMIMTQGYNAVPPPPPSQQSRKSGGGKAKGRGGSSAASRGRGGSPAASRGRGGGPTAAVLKKMEDDKREYAEYLEKKQWLTQAIPGTVKKLY